MKKPPVPSQKVGAQGAHSGCQDRRYTIGESLGGEVFGHAIGWAASRLSGALEGVLGEGPRHGTHLYVYTLIFCNICNSYY